MLYLQNQQPRVAFPQLGLPAAPADVACLVVHAVGVSRLPDGTPQVGGRHGTGIKASGITGAAFFGDINGVEGQSGNPNASGVYGHNVGGGYGVAGRTPGGNRQFLGRTRAAETECRATPRIRMPAACTATTITMAADSV
jgi:hypothetical protein